MIERESCIHPYIPHAFATLCEQVQLAAELCRNIKEILVYFRLVYFFSHSPANHEKPLLWITRVNHDEAVVDPQREV